MAELDERSFKRDRRFLVRLVVILLVGVAAGIWMFAYMTGQSAKGCASDTVGDVAGQPASE